MPKIWTDEQIERIIECALNLWDKVGRAGPDATLLTVAPPEPSEIEQAAFELALRRGQHWYGRETALRLMKQERDTYLFLSRTDPQNIATHPQVETLVGRDVHVILPEGKGTVRGPLSIIAGSTMRYQVITGCFGIQFPASCVEDVDGPIIGLKLKDQPATAHRAKDN